MHIYYFSVMSSSSHQPWQWRAEKADNGSLTFGLALGLSCSSFLAAASMDAAAPSSSVSAITVGSSGSTHSEPETCFQEPKLSTSWAAHHTVMPTKPADLTHKNTASHAQVMEATMEHSLHQRWSNSFRMWCIRSKAADGAESVLDNTTSSWISKWD